jgi:hypothetical protein
MVIIGSRDRDMREGAPNGRFDGVLTPLGEPNVEQFPSSYGFAVRLKALRRVSKEALYGDRPGQSQKDRQEPRPIH